MGNIIAYLNETKSTTLAERPLNEVDGLVLSYLAYFDLRGIVPAPRTHGSLTVAKAGRRYLAKHGNTQPDVNSDVFRQLIVSQRFGDARLSDYTDVFRRGRTQFAALRIALPDGSAYLAFRGSDNSLTAWQEAFAISYGHTPAQQMAVRWLDRVAARHPVQPLIVGGHSKGGNMALYAASACRPELRSRIGRIYLYDSPGLTPCLYGPASFAEIENRITRIVPAYSLVGQLFAHNAPDIVVACSTDGINQHEPLFWQTADGAFITAEQDAGSRRLALALNRWIASATFREREAFTRDLFRTLRRRRTEGAEAVPTPRADNNITAVKRTTTRGRRRDTARTLLQFYLTASRPARSAARKLIGAYYVTRLYAAAKRLGITTAIRKPANRFRAL